MVFRDLNAAGQDLLTAACTGRLAEIVQILLECGVPIDTQDTTGRTALLHATESGLADVSAALLYQGGASVQDRTKDGACPLAAAMAANCHDCAEMLLRCGADANTKDASGRTPLMRAAASGAATGMKIILEHHKPAYLDSRDETGQTALMVAVQYGREEAVKILLQHGADPSLADHGNALSRRSDPDLLLKLLRACV
jgi:ankyrin repeat protein